MSWATNGSAVFALLILIFITQRIALMRRNYAVAKTTGFPVYYSPFHREDQLWQALSPLILPFLLKLPKSWTFPWLPLMQRWEFWRDGHAPYAAIGSDTVVFATPKGNVISTCDGSVVSQFFLQSKSIHINIDVTKIFDVWGPVIVMVEGEEWKAHRKVVNAGLNPQTHTLVWISAIEETQQLLDIWVREGSVIPIMFKPISTLALHIMSGVFFGNKLQWTQRDHIPAGHRMGFQTALTKVTENLVIIFLLRKSILFKLPLQKLKDSRLALSEWTAYMHEMREKVLRNIDEAEKNPRKTLLEHLVLAGLKEDGPGALPPDHAIGNTFFLMLAGHETAANTMTFSLVLLAIFPEWQKRIQNELDAQLGNRTPSEWSLDDDYAGLRSGSISAVIREAMRLLGPVPNIARKVVSPTTITDSQGTPHHIPVDSSIMINSIAMHRNPNVWSPLPTHQAEEFSPERRAELHNSPVLDFNPQQWIDDPTLQVTARKKWGSHESASFSKDNVPVYFAFGQGVRSCPGELFAFVEMTAVFATIFKKYSLVLDVDKATLDNFAGDQDAAWRHVRDNAIRSLKDDMTAPVMIEFSARLPLRLVPRS